VSEAPAGDSPLDSGFGTPSASVAELDDEAVGEVMTTVLLRNRMYAAMRGALPLDLLLNGTECHSNIERVDQAYAFEAAMACTIPEPQSAGLVQGEVLLEQGGVDDVYFITLSYQDVSVPGASVDGIEHVTEVVGGGGTTEIELDLVHDGFAFDYTFRMQLLSEGTPAFDYEIDGPTGLLGVRLTNPTTAGAFATATITGVDTSMTCEIRNTAWTPGAPARGTCDGGVVFGL